MHTADQEQQPRRKASDVALIFEGGGMRNSYTAACVTTLLEQGIDVGWVGGISAGASLTVNYLAGDIGRNIGSMTDIAADPRFGGWGGFFRGKGYFDADYMYEQAPLMHFENFGPFRFDTLLHSDIPFRIGSVCLDDGSNHYWGRDDITDVVSLMRLVRASSSLPGLMSPTLLDGKQYVDGAFGPSGGIPLDAAIADGFDKFLVIRTRPRDYRRPEVSRPGLVRQVFRKKPQLAELMIARPALYNETSDRLAELEKQGKALQFFPEKMLINNRERNLSKIQQSYASGYEQSQRELPAWLEFLDLD